jgi:hypothetical protein
MNLKLPTLATLGLSLLAGVLVVLNVTAFGFGQPWLIGTTLALTFLAALGISPLTGASFKAALHLSNGISNAIAAALVALQLGLSTVTMSTGVHAILAGCITLLAGLGFAPAVLPTPVPVARKVLP